MFEVNRFKAIATLEQSLKAIECDLCFAMAEHDSQEKVEELFEQRRHLIRELQQVR